MINVASAMFALSLLAPATSLRPERVPGSVLVHLRAPSARLAAVMAEGEARVQKRLAGGALQLVLADKSDGAAAQLLQRLQRLPAVLWVEAEHHRYGQQAAVNDPRYEEQWALPLLQMPTAWQRTHGSPHVVVAVIDSGIRPHPELAGRLLPGYDFITDPDSAADGDGRDADPTDAGALAPGSSGLHGLHITGILGAQANNQAGIAGIDWNCRILPVRALGVHNAGGRDSDIADAIRWAAGLPVDGVADNPNPAQIINLSFGGPGGSQLLQEAVDAATARGALVIAAAGNDATDVATYAPAGLAGVIAVGAADDLGALAGYSNFGRRLDLLAPGGGRTEQPESGVLSTMYLAGPQDGGWTYFFQAGTSQAAAHVSGVAALLRAMAPQLPPQQIRQLLIATADSRAQCPQGCGAGLLNADAATAATAAAAGCEPGCRLHEECVDHGCVAFTPLEVLPSAGCSATAAAQAETPWNLILLAALGLMVRKRYGVTRATDCGGRPTSRAGSVSGAPVAGPRYSPTGI